MSKISKTLFMLTVTASLLAAQGESRENQAVSLESIHHIQNIARPTRREELHSPRITLPAGIRKDEIFFVRIRVGSYPHPMNLQHRIIYMEWYFNNIYQGQIHFSEKVPVAEVEVPLRISGEGELHVLARCNRDGLWENSVRINPIP